MRKGAIQNFYKRDEYPGNITIRKIKSLDNLNKSWWESGLGSAFEATLSTVGEPELKSYADELINTLRLTNDHLFQLTEDQRERITELEKQIKELKGEFNK